MSFDLQTVAAWCSIASCAIVAAEVGAAVYTLTHRRVRVWLEKKFRRDI